MSLVTAATVIGLSICVLIWLVYLLDSPVDVARDSVAPAVSTTHGDHIDGLGISSPKVSWGRAFFSFKGRIPRRVYWGLNMMLQLATLLILSGSAFVAAMLRGQEKQAISAAVDSVVAFYGRGKALETLIPWPILLAALFLTLWSAMALAVKRLHDRNKSGWACLFIFFPILGPIWCLIELGMLRGSRGDNRFGPDPT